MLLHEKFSDPSAPNAVWFWGVGALDLSAEKTFGNFALPSVWTNDNYTRGFYRICRAAERCAEIPIDPQTVIDDQSERRLVVMRDRHLDELERDWFAPLLGAVDSGKLDTLELHLDGQSMIARRSLLRRLFARPRPLSELHMGIDA
jgi:hypothetical protein